MDRRPPAPHRPPLAELRALVRKPVEPWASARFYRRVSLVLTWWLMPASIRPATISWMGALLGAAGMAAWAWSPWDWKWALAGIAGLQLAFLADHVDGELARARRTPSRGGAYADEVAFEAIVPTAVAFGVAFVVVGTLGGIWWSIIAVAFAAGKVLSSLTFFVSMRYRRDTANREASVAPSPKPGLAFRVAQWWWAGSKVTGAVTTAALADVALVASGWLPMTVRGVPISVVGAYAGVGVLVYLVGTMRSWSRGTRGDFTVNA